MDATAPAGFHEPLAARLSLAGARALYAGPSLKLAPHRNAVATVALAMTEEPFALALADGGEAGSEMVAALIPPRARHRLVARGPMLFLYLDALDDDYLSLLPSALDEGHRRLVHHGVASTMGLSIGALCEELGLKARVPADDRIATIVRAMDDAPDRFPRVGAAAAAAGLSASRLQLLFRQATGVPFRRYRLWRRMALVFSRVAAGDTLTMAALDAGFASSAHLSATFKAMFGLSPSALLETKPRIAVA